MTTGPIPPGAHRLLNAPGFQESIRLQSEAFLQVNEAEPRLASIFATQQRWLMAHVGLSLHFEGESGQEPEGLTAARFLHRVHLFDIASRNTAAAFLGEMQHYGVVTQRPDARDRRKRYLLPTPITLAAIDTWLRIHLDTLDRLDGADRVARFDAAPGQIQHIQPMIADGLARSDVIRNPSPDFSHFMWINNGFLMTERFFAAIGADLRHGGGQAFYAPGSDHIQMPARETFRAASGYYSTLAHEHAHWTGHKRRLDRDLSKGRFGNPAYAFEELVAELSAAMTCAELALDLVDFDNSAAYLQSWLKALKEDKTAIFRAATMATAATQFLIDRAEKGGAQIAA